MHMLSGGLYSLKSRQFIPDLLVRVFLARIRLNRKVPNATELLRETTNFRISKSGSRSPRTVDAD